MNWKSIEDAPLGVQILATGYNNGDPKRGRHVVITECSDGGYFYDETGAEYSYLTHFVLLDELELPE